MSPPSANPLFAITYSIFVIVYIYTRSFKSIIPNVYGFSD